MENLDTATSRLFEAISCYDSRRGINSSLDWDDAVCRSAKNQIEAGADVNATCSFRALSHYYGICIFPIRHLNDLTPFFMACFTGNLKLVKLLSDAGASDERALHAAVQGSYYHGLCPELVKFLLGLGFDVNLNVLAKENIPMTPLGIAADLGHVDTVKLFIEEGADVNQCGFWSPLWMTLTGGVSNADALEIAKLLLQRGADPNASYFCVCPEANGCICSFAYGYASPIHVAIYYEKVELVRLLLEHDADPNVCDDGSSMLELAVRSENAELVQVLFDHQKPVLPAYKSEEEEEEEEEDEDDD